MRICLTGYRGSGKSAVGLRLAERLGLPFFDTDALIAEHSGRTIRQIVADGGWEAFRLLERQAIAGLARESGIVALGGGAVLDRVNVEALKTDGFFIWLTAGMDILFARLDADAKTAEQRPPLAEGDRREVERTLRERLPVYRRVADWVVDTSALTVDEVAEKIAAFMEQRLPIGEGRPRQGG